MLKNREFSIINNYVTIKPISKEFNDGWKCSKVTIFKKFNKHV